MFVPVVVLAVTLLQSQAAAQEYAKLSPYPGLRFTAEDAPEVVVAGAWVGLVAIDGVPAAQIVAFARRHHGDRWQKRFGEDLVQVMSEMEHPPGATVTLVVRDLDTGGLRTLEDVPMTRENREAIRGAKSAAGAGAVPVDAAEMSRAIDAFEEAIERRWSYRRANDADFAGAIAAARERVRAGATIDALGLDLQKIVALGIDGHAEVSGFELPRGAGLPFLVEAVGERFVAFEPGRRGFLAGGFPYVVAIDGRPIEEWRDAAAVLVPKGSPQYVARHALRVLRDLDFVRGMLGVAAVTTVAVELAAERGRQRKTVTLPVARGPSAYGAWPRTTSRRLDGDVGYLRLASMDDDAAGEIDRWMDEFAGTRGLIVDVRDNGGGGRDALLALYARLARPGDPPRVFTAAAYRLHDEHGDDHLAQRFMRRADDPRWSGAERDAIAAFAKGFRPRWTLPEGEFSEWHYMLLSAGDEGGATRPKRFDRPVVVLMNAKCFSATDVFLAGLKGMEQVTLLGTASGGGSALRQTIALGATPLRLSIGSMASFQADGRLFDGNGVAPDVVVEPEPEYFVGGRDAQLEAALARLRRK